VNTTTVLIVEDDPAMLRGLKDNFEFEGYKVLTATDGDAGIKAALSGQPDLVVLDVMLPDLDGFSVVRQLRGRRRAVPVVFLTAKDANEDKVMGLTVGGDDYVTKPFSLEEMVARIRAVLRRTQGTTEVTRLVTGDLELDEDSHEVWRGGTPVALSPTEFKLLRYLMVNAGRVLSKAQILDHVWNYDFDGNSNIVESYISYLRRKVDLVEPHLIHTLRGVGYVLRVPPA